MTAKRNENGELEVIKVGNMTFTYRTALLILILSATPMGEGILDKLGIVKGNVKATEQLEAKIDKIKQQVKDLDSDVHGLTTSMLEVKKRLDSKPDLGIK
jgi:cell division protein FtsB